MLRRDLLRSAALAPLAVRTSASAVEVIHLGGARSLALCPIGLRGDFRGTPLEALLTALNRIRAVCLENVRLVSDRQPDGLAIEGRITGPPMVVIDPDINHSAWIVLNVGLRDWRQIAYEFGHELGHVLCNSWGPTALSPTPCRWLEEALVEAFSIRNLSRLADSWERNPPFPGDSAYGAEIRRYRGWQLDPYKRLAAAAGADQDLAGWFHRRREALDRTAGIDPPATEAVPALVEEMNADPSIIQGLGAMSRWERRTRVPMPEFLDRWERSCQDLGASPGLPRRIRVRLGV
jgi:hypothetical protein